MKLQTKTLGPGTYLIRQFSSDVLNYFRRCSMQLLVLLGLMAILATPTMSQSGYTLWGDVKLDDSKADTPGPSSLTVVLYDQSTKIVGRQTIGSRGQD